MAVGAIAGIVVAVCALLLASALAIVYIVRRQERRRLVRAPVCPVVFLKSFHGIQGSMVWQPPSAAPPAPAMTPNPIYEASTTAHTPNALYEPVRHTPNALYEPARLPAAWPGEEDA